MKTCIQHSLCCCLLLLSLAANAQKSDSLQDRWKPYIHLDQYLEPFWQADTIYDELVLPIREGGKPDGTLLLPAKKILKVTSANLQKEFEQGRDWIYTQGRFTLPAGSTIPSLTKEELVFTTPRQGFSMAGSTKGSYVLFSESNYFRSVQIAVTYVVKRKEWKGPVPRFSPDQLPQTIARLHHGDSLKIVFYGNSIETGANSSQYQNESPFMPSWPELIVYNLLSHYRSPVQFNNQSIGGKMSKWGLDSIGSTVLPQHPDLVVIGFGMNDGSVKVSPEQYRQTIGGIVDAVQKQNPAAECILVAPMLANPFAIQHGIQDQYKSELDKLARTGVVIADLTTVHAELLKHKRYQDMTGNNVNHPNDYLARWYAQVVSALLIDNTRK